MTNKEMLELAAKAAKYEIFLDDDGNFYLVTVTGNRRYWNPLEDDGDALRLAIKCGIVIETSAPLNFDFDDANGFELGVSAWHVFIEGNNGGNVAESKEVYGNDPCAASRLAITKVAAEIGKATGEQA